MVSKAWQDLDPDERNRYENMARQDKARYEIEKSLYSGPWKVLKTKGARKDPKAPKRPMSTFLSFSRDKRRLVMQENPKMTNAEVSRKLAQMWKEASDEVKQQYVQREQELRKQYLQDAAEFREHSRKQLAEKRQQREELALQHVAMLDAVRGNAEAKLGQDNTEDDDPRSDFDSSMHSASSVTRAGEGATSSGTPLLPEERRGLSSAGAVSSLPATKITEDQILEALASRRPAIDPAALLSLGATADGYRREDLLAAERLLSNPESSLLAEKLQMQQRMGGVIDPQLLQSLLAPGIASPLTSRLSPLGGIDPNMSSLLSLQARSLLGSRGTAGLLGPAALGLRSPQELALLDEYSLASALGPSSALTPAALPPLLMGQQQSAIAPSTSLLARTYMGASDDLLASEILAQRLTAAAPNRAPQPLVTGSGAPTTSLTTSLSGHLVERSSNVQTDGAGDSDHRDLVAAALRLDEARRSSFLGRQLRSTNSDEAEDYTRV